jgi:hypothetical protein
VLAHERLGEAETVGQDDGLAVLLEDGRVIAGGVMKRHREHAELDRHGNLPGRRRRQNGDVGQRASIS